KVEPTGHRQGGNRDAKHRPGRRIGSGSGDRQSVLTDGYFGTIPCDLLHSRSSRTPALMDVRGPTAAPLRSSLPHHRPLEPGAFPRRLSRGSIGHCHTCRICATGAASRVYQSPTASPQRPEQAEAEVAGKPKGKRTSYGPFKGQPQERPSRIGLWQSLFRTKP